MFIDQQYPVNKVLSICKLSRSSYYYKPVETPKAKGKSKSETTFHAEKGWVSNDVVVEDIKRLLECEFVDYGYIKTGYYLNDTAKYLINHKKVYRLMKEHKLLNISRHKVKKGNKQWVKQLVPQPDNAFKYWEFDIKFIHIDGENRKAPLLSIVDVYSRYLIGWVMDWSIKKEDVVGFFDAILRDYVIPDNVSVRCDNGSQFESNLVRDYLATNNISQEFTLPATPQQNAHIEAYHSIITSAICNRIELTDMKTTREVFTRWEKFYNAERIHSGIEYKSPLQYLRDKNIVIPKKIIPQKDIFTTHHETEVGSAGEQPTRDSDVKRW
jgi:putative transposase